ncbi:type II secretion system protein [Halalkalibacter urbisdiaboli]|uniref:type II secretion system protein n=1 Tax=Halalkalibacter urbisdiaboli TaxID=1960589 RepID=UPI000B44DA85|nr:type II secretion system protein [Halalkalibacter urbisdiaboli]
MRKLIKQRLKNQKGLTLIELLVVIVILGIIAAIAVPMVMGNRESAAEAVATQTNAIVRDAIDRYLVVEGEPADPKDLTVELLDTEKYIDKSTVKCPDGYTPHGTDKTITRDTDYCQEIK